MKLKKIIITLSTSLICTITNAQSSKPLKQNIRNSNMNQIEFKFKTQSIKIKISSVASSSTIVGIEGGSNDTQSLKLSTPQFNNQPILNVPLLLISNFSGIKSINLDIQSLGYKDVKITNKKLIAGQLYHWQTPTKGSATFFYLQNPKNKSLAIKLGPFPDSVLNDFKIDWASAIWTEMSADH